MFGAEVFSGVEIPARSPYAGSFLYETTIKCPTLYTQMDRRGGLHRSKFRAVCVSCELREVT